MVSGPEQSHNLPPWLQVQRPQSEPHDVHKSASQPAEKQAPRPAEKQAQRMADHGIGFYKGQGVASPTKIPWSGTFDRMKNL
jgi:hypothetical protein